MLVASKTVLYSLRLGESNRMGFSIVQPEVRFGQNDVPPQCWELFKGKKLYREQ
jgi:hypothetical protein